MTDNLDQLDALAAAATPGPWESWVGDGGAGINIPTVAPRSERIRWDNTIYSDRPEADAAYIAACDPATIRSLVAEVRRGREIEAAARAHLDWEYRVRGAKRFTLTALRAALHREDGA